MISLPLSFTTSVIPPLTHRRLNLLPTRLRTPLRPRFTPAADSSFAAAGGEYRPGERMRTLFPGGVKRPEIRVPSLVLELTCRDVLEFENCLALVDAAVGTWVGMVVLDGGEESGGRLYMAARALKAAIRDRAYFLISERVDVASIK